MTVTVSRQIAVPAEPVDHVLAGWTERLPVRSHLRKVHVAELARATEPTA